MKPYLLLSFGLLGWAFYELSGGSEFEPHDRAIIDPASDVKVTSNFTASKPSALATEGSETMVQLAATIDIPEETKVSLESIPTTRRLIGEIAPTPQDDRIAMGPKTIETDATSESLLTLASYAAPDLRQVSGSRVNMRNGPGTSYSVVTTLDRNTEVEVLQSPGTGWVKLQVVETGRIGWMTERLLIKKDG